jgi:hypothetical protein
MYAPIPNYRLTALEISAPDALLRKLTEQTLKQPKPRVACHRETYVKARLPTQPTLYPRTLIPFMAIIDQIKPAPEGEGLATEPRGSNLFIATMTSNHLGNDIPLMDTQSSEQSRSSNSTVVMCYCF